MPSPRLLVPFLVSALLSLPLACSNFSPHRASIPTPAAAPAPPDPAPAAEPGVGTILAEAPASPAPVAEAPPSGALPDFANIPYGSHQRQVLNFWRASSSVPAPVVIHMHGGGWTNGEKHERANSDVRRLLDAGISYVSFTYRLVPEARKAKVMPPVEWPMSDAARVVQFVRSKAAEWNIDKSRVAMTGGSAGACSSLWVAFSDDLADPSSADPVARESTRLSCVAVDEAQTSLDPAQMKAWIPNIAYGYHAFGFNAGSNYEARVAAFAKFLENRESVLPWIRRYSPYALATPDDPPVYLRYKNRPSPGQPQKDATHSADFGVKLKEHLDALGVRCELTYPGSGDNTHPTTADYLIESLRASP